MFKPGQSGNPSGKQPNKRFLAALDRAIAQDDSEKLRQAAERLLEQAAAGEAWAIGMLADRLDGRPKQDADINLGATDGLIDLLSRSRASKASE